MKFILHKFNNINEFIFKEKILNNNIVTWGDDNCYPYFILELLNKSSIHNAIINRKTLMLISNGVNTDELDEEGLFLFNNQNNKLNLNNILYKLFYDLEVFGGFTFQVIYNKKLDKIVEINYVPIHKLRFDKDMKYIYYFKNINKFYIKNGIKMNLFDLNNPTDSQIFYYKEYRPGVEYYPIPNYISAINWIELDYEISNYHLNQVRKGFFPNMIISLNNGIPNDDEMNKIVNELKKQYEGAKGELVMFLFSEDKSKSPEITPINLNNSDEKFIELMKQVNQNILTAHQVTAPILMGIATPGSLSNKKEIIESSEVFYSLYIKPKQEQVLTIFNKILEYNKSNSKLSIKKIEI